VEVYLDDAPLDIDAPDGSSLEQLTQQVSRRLRGTGRVITAVRCDGRTVPADELECTLARPAREYGSIEFQSSEVAGLVRAAMQEAGRLFIESDRLRHKAADLLNEAKSSRAMELLGQCFRIWSQVYETVLKGAQLRQVNLLAVDVPDVDVTAWLGLLADRLREVKGALEVGDHVLLADLLRYEFDDVSEQWKRLLGHLADG